MLEKQTTESRVPQGSLLVLIQYCEFRLKKCIESNSERTCSSNAAPWIVKDTAQAVRRVRGFGDLTRRLVWPSPPEVRRGQHPTGPTTTSSGSSMLISDCYQLYRSSVRPLHGRQADRNSGRKDDGTHWEYDFISGVKENVNRTLAYMKARGHR